jgi:hypothetical protein
LTNSDIAIVPPWSRPPRNGAARAAARVNRR